MGIITHKEIYQHLGDLHNSVSHFTKSSMSLSLTTFKVQDRLIDFSITGHEKLIDMVSDSILQQTFKKLPLVKFWHSIKEEYPKLSEEL